MTAHKITLYGANGDIIDLGREGSQIEGYSIMRDGLVGYFDAVTTTEWTRARRQRGGRHKGMEQAEREIEIPFRVTGTDWARLDSRLARMIPYHLDRWDDDARLASIGIEADNTERFLDVQRSREPQYRNGFGPIEALDRGQGIVTYFLKAAQPMWSGKPKVSVWEAAGTSGSGTITVHNPTDQEMFQEWVLTPGTWTLPDVSWHGAAGKRTIREHRVIQLNPAPNGLRITLDPMERMFRNEDGTNASGQVAGGYYLLHTIPPYTPKTELPISVHGAPSGGARAELHQPQLWSRPWGLQ